MTEIEELQKRLEELQKQNCLIRVAGKPQKVVAHTGVSVKGSDVKRPQKHYQQNSGKTEHIPAVPYIDVVEA